MPRLVNYMEQIVLNKLKELQEKNEAICRCEYCTFDIAAIALNNLPPRYVVSEKGKLYAKLDTMGTQFEIDLLMALNKGVTIVTSSPNHENRN